MRHRVALCACALWIVILIAAPAAAAAPAGPAAGHHHHERADIGAVIGGATLIGALLLWSFGYGLLGGRITPLSTRLPRERR